MAQASIKSEELKMALKTTRCGTTLASRSDKRTFKEKRRF